MAVDTEGPAGISGTRTTKITTERMAAIADAKKGQALKAKSKSTRSEPDPLVRLMGE